MDNPIIICELCRHEIGVVLMDKIKQPIMGDMFGSIDPVHEAPPPFEPSAEWRYMSCPMGRRHRAFIEDNAIATNKGWLLVNENGYCFVPALAPEVALNHNPTICELMEINFGGNESDLKTIIAHYPTHVEVAETAKPKKRGRKPGTIKKIKEVKDKTTKTRREIAADVAKYRAKRAQEQPADNIQTDTQ